MIRYSRSVVMLLLIAAVVTIPVRGQSSPPAMFFTDINSGPNSGGESVSGYAGAYVTIYGNFFGTTQGSSTVTLNGASCGRVVSWGTTWNWYQKIVWQLGSTCTSGALSVNVNGVSSICENNDDGNGCNFTVRSGNIRCVSTAGSNSNSGTFSGGCWLTPYYAATHLSAGDIAYVENGVVEDTDSGTGCSTYMDLGYCGSVTSGTAASPIALLGYPGATATIGDLTNTSDPRTTKFQSTYWRIGEMTLRAQGIAFLNGGNYSWLIGNDIQCTNPGAQAAGCVINQSSTYAYGWGNYIHDIAPNNNNKEGHTYYVGSNANHSWVGWNYSVRNNSCYNIQSHSSSADDTYDIHIHDNMINGDTCTGINLETMNPSSGTIEAYNNVIWNVGLETQTNYPELNGYNLACIMGNQTTPEAGPAGTGTAQVYNNTCFNAGYPGNSMAEIPSFRACFDFNIEPTTFVNLTNNACYQPNPSGSGNGYSIAQTYFGPDTSNITCGGNNLYYGVGSSSFCTTSAQNNVNPLFTATNITAAADSTSNFIPQSTSLLIGNGSTAKHSTYDITGLQRPNPPSIGAYEYSGTTTSVAKPNPPTNLVVTTN